MRRRLVIVLLLIVGDAIVNVAVALGLGAWGETSSLPYGFAITKPPPITATLVSGDIPIAILHGGGEYRIGWPARTLARPLWFWSSGTRVLWPGFAINTAFYAGVLWLLFAAPFALRRRIRIRRGLCPACAYPVGDSAVCTECGKALVMQKEETLKA